MSKMQGEQARDETFRKFHSEVIEHLSYIDEYFRIADPEEFSEAYNQREGIISWLGVWYSLDTVKDSMGIDLWEGAKRNLMTIYSLNLS